MSTESQSDNKKTIKKEFTEDETLAFKAERIFAKNWFVIAIVSIGITFYALYVLEKTASAIEDLKDTVYTNNLYTIMTTVDGRSIKVKKTKLEAKFIEKWLAKTLVENFIVSRSEITDNFKVNKFTSPSDVIANSYKLQFIYQDLMSKKNKESQKDLRTYLFKLQSMLGEDKMPEFITINNYKVEYFKFNQNSFSIKVNVSVGTVNYDLSKDSKYEKRGVVPIEVKGYVDLAESTELNPYGLIIKNFKIGVVVK